MSVPVHSLTYQSSLGTNRGVEISSHDQKVARRHCIQCTTQNIPDLPALSPLLLRICFIADPLVDAKDI